MTKSPFSILHSPFSIWSLVIVLLLLTWGLRICCLEDVPPGWRDDELINIHALSGELLAGRFPLYFTGASGHEPLYHYLHAGVHAVLGFNVLSGHLLSAACGTLTVALTYSLARRLFGRTTAVMASLALATSFWSLMYSRTAIRHISLPPFALAAFYLFWRKKPGFFRKTWFLVGLIVGISLYTYPAARLLPVLLILFAAYLALFHRHQFSRHWRGVLLALAVTAALALPLAVTIAQGRSEAAAQGIGADARLAELAVPLRELRAGNPRPLLENIWTTLGMFHATGDPEWLYNIPHRPVFNLLGGVLLWAGAALCLYRWRQPRYFFLLLWFALGLLPAFVSTPPASLSHIILAQPVAYILPALVVGKLVDWETGRLVQWETGTKVIGCLLAFLFLTTNAARDLRDYFVAWPQAGLVRFLYRADYREAARYLDGHPEVVDVAIGSTLLGPWDRLALASDLRREDVQVRVFNPEWALLLPAGPAPVILPTTFPTLAPAFEALIGGAPAQEKGGLRLYRPAAGLALPGDDLSVAFANGLELMGVTWPEGEPLPGREAVAWLTWLVARPLDLPPIPIVAHPPPPGVYSGPRLAAFAHLLAVDGTFLVGDDGLWVDPLTLRPGDRFIQAHRFALPPDAPAGPYTLEVGLYDPLDGQRWAVLDAAGQPVADRIFLLAAEGEP